MAMQAGNTGEYLPTHLARFDSDSSRIGIDTLCSRSMSGSKEHFQNLKLFRSNSIVDGIKDGLEIAGAGTFVFSIQDDLGQKDTIHIPDSLYVPGLKMPLLSPQHWAQTAVAASSTATKHSPEDKRGTRIVNLADCCEMYWNKGTRKKTVTHDKFTNTPIFRTAPGSSIYRAFEAQVMANDAHFYNERIRVDLGRLRREVHRDPAEFGK